MIKSQKNRRLETIWQKKILFMVVMSIFFIQLISAFDFLPVKEYIQPTLTAKYGTIKINNVLGLGETLKDVDLIFNTDHCGEFCYAEGTTTMYSTGKLFDEITFRSSKKSTKYFERNYKIWIGKQTTRTVDVPIYSEVCLTAINGTYSCNKVQTGTNKVNEDYITYDTEYKFSDLKAGSYYWKLEGTKEARETIDWVPVLNGIKGTEWASWYPSLATNISDGFPISNSQTSGEQGGVYFNGSIIWVTHPGAGYRVSAFNTSGYNLTSLFGRSTALGFQPYGIDSNGSDFFITGNQNKSVARYTKDWNLISNFSTVPSGNADPFGLATNGTDIWVADRTNNFIYHYNLSGYNMSDGFSPSVYGSGDTIGIAIDDDYFYIPDGTDKFVYVIDRATMTNTTFGFSMSIMDSSLTDVTLTINGEDMYVIENGRNWVWHLELTGDSSPIVETNSPINYYNSTSSTIIFNGSASDNRQIENISLYINGVRNFTYTYGTGNYTNLTLVRTLADGRYNWTMSATDNATIPQTTFAPNKTLIVDTSSPVVNITYPYNKVNYQINSNNLTINYSVSDLNLDKCWGSFDGGATNISLTCADNNLTINITSRTNNTFTFYANDTLGNYNSISRTWNYIVYQNNLSYVQSTFEGATENFILNFTQGGSSPLSVAKLIYNVTEHPSTISSSTGEIIVSNLISIPTVTTTINNTFYWNLIFSDGSMINTTFNNQTITGLQIDNCTAYTTLIYNFTMFDEENKSLLTNTTIELQLNWYDSTGEILILNLSDKYAEKNPISVCINSSLLTTINYSIDATLKYSSNSSGDPYVTKYYNILNQIITNSTVPKHISLYDLLSADSTDFQLTFRDKNLAFAPNILVYVYRQYVADNDFKVVEVPLTDSNGQTVLHLVRNDVLYNLVMVNSSNDIVATFNRIVAFCQDYTIGNCQINLNALPESDSLYVYTDDLGISYTNPTYSNTTDLVSFSFLSNNLSSVNVSMEIVRNNQFGNRSICTSSLYSSTGLLSCDVSSIVNTDRYLFVYISVNGDLKATSTIDLEGDTSAFGVVNGAFLAFLLLICIVCFFMEDKQVLTIALVVGWAGILALGMINGKLIGTVAGGIWLIVSAIIFVWKLKKEEVGA